MEDSAVTSSQHRAAVVHVPENMERFRDHKAYQGVGAPRFFQAQSTVFGGGRVFCCFLLKCSFAGKPVQLSAFASTKHGVHRRAKVVYGTQNMTPSTM